MGSESSVGGCCGSHMRGDPHNPACGDSDKSKALIGQDLCLVGRGASDNPELRMDLGLLVPAMGWVLRLFIAKGRALPWSGAELGQCQSLWAVRN